LNNISGIDFVCLSGAGYEKIALLMRNVSFFLTKTIMDEQLCELLKKALQNPEGSSERDQSIETLCIIVTQLKEDQGKFSHYLEPYYPEALEKTKEYFNKDETLSNYLNQANLNLNNIDCQSSDDVKRIQEYLIRWIWSIFKKRSIDQYRRTKNLLKNPVSTDQPRSNDPEQGTVENTIPCPTLTGFALLLENELKQIARQLKHQIEIDPENRFRNCHIKNRQDGNCQTLIKLRYLKEPPLTLKETSKKLKIKLPTISNHIDKKCKKLLREIAEELGYE
jgi:hypothetical protein